MSLPPRKISQVGKLILFVVHRYRPFPGGSEEYVASMAEEMLSQGFDVTVLAHEHMGDLNGVKVTNDYQILLDPKWALIIVHGCDCVSQNVVHQNARKIPSPVLYLIIKPSDSQTALFAARHHRFLGYSTSEDFQWVQKLQLEQKARRVTHGINQADSTSKRLENPVGGLRYFMSAGGFWPHKGFEGLAQAFTEAMKLGDNDMTQLFLYGYSDHAAPEGYPNVTNIRGAKRSEVIDAMAWADALIMNSAEEGFGLVLLEAMLNKTPWIARDIAGASMLKDFGTVYNDESDLIKILKTFDKNDPKIKKKVERGYWHVASHHLIYNTIDDIKEILDDAQYVSGASPALTTFRGEA